MLPTLHEILLTQSADRRSRKGPAFLTRNGTRQHPDNIRARLLAGVLGRANTLLAERGEQPIAHMTPHTLRRTFASLLAEIGVSPRRAMYLLGHTVFRRRMGPCTSGHAAAGRPERARSRPPRRHLLPCIR